MDINELLLKAEQGDTNAQLQLGLYYKGLVNTNENLQKAFYWFEKASKSREPLPCFYLAECYTYGYGVQENLNMGFYWYKVAGTKKYAPAQYQVGYFYYNGIVEKKSVKNAISWWVKASKQGDINACYMLAKMK